MFHVKYWLPFVYWCESKRCGNKADKCNAVKPQSNSLYRALLALASLPPAPAMPPPPRLAGTSVRGIGTVPSGKRSAVKTFLVSHQAVTFTRYKFHNIDIIFYPFSFSPVASRGLLCTLVPCTLYFVQLDLARE